jgi:FKBP12-rapamycin complex-associated protein
VALEEHLHLLLPALMRLVSPAVSVTPLDVRRSVLRSLKRLLPRMRLAGFGSALLHPLIKVGGAGCVCVCVCLCVCV